MDSAKAIIEAIGEDRFREMLRVGKKSVSRAASLNQFTASWYRAIAEELRLRDFPPPAQALFTFKDRVPTADEGTG